MKPEMVPQRSLKQVGSARSVAASSGAEPSAAPPRAPALGSGRPAFEGARAGRVLGGRYQLEALLGVGAMGEVYRALDLERRQPCAIKLVFPGAVRTLKAERRFRQEAEVVARLFHPNIVEVREFRADGDGTLFLVMELLTGQDLYGVLLRHGRMALPRALEILRGVGAALQYAHDLGVVHRDIKPNNIFLCRRALTNGLEIETVKVLDFGLAKLEDYSFVVGGAEKLGASAGEAPLTQGLVVGTPAYLAPEATMAGGRLVDARSDQWSLAVLAYEMLSGQLPFPEPNPHPLCLQIRHQPHIDLRTLVPDLPEHVYAAIDTALSKDQEQRFRKVQDFIRALDNLPPLGQSSTNHAAALEAEGRQRARQSARQEPGMSASALPPRGLTSTPAFVAPERTTVSALALGVHLPSLAEAPPEALRTVQYSTEDLLALTQRAAREDAGVPVPVTEHTPTRRYEALPERPRKPSAPSLTELCAAAQSAPPPAGWPALPPPPSVAPVLPLPPPDARPAAMKAMSPPPPPSPPSSSAPPPPPPPLSAVSPSLPQTPPPMFVDLSDEDRTSAVRSSERAVFSAVERRRMWQRRGRARTAGPWVFGGLFLLGALLAGLHHAWNHAPRAFPVPHAAQLSSASPPA